MNVSHPINTHKSAARHHLVSLGLLAALTLAMFGDVLFSSGAVVLSSGGDLSSQFIYWRKFGFDQLRHGNLALWNSHLFCGAPFLGGFQSALLYPPNALFLILPLTTAINWSIALHVFLAGAFTYAWVVRRGLGSPSGFLAAVMFMFGGTYFLHIYAGHLPNLCTMVWAPLLLMAIDGLFESPSLGWSLLGMFAMAMQVLAGHPQYVFYTGFAAGIYCAFCLFKTRLRKQFALGLAGIAVGGVGLSAVQLFTSFDESREMLRSSGVSYLFASWFSFPPENFLTLLSPNLFGDMTTGTYWGRCYLWEASLFISMTGLVLAVAGAVWGERNTRRFSIIMVALLLLLALGRHTPLFNLLYEWVPGFNAFRGIAKFIFLASLFLAMLAGIGFDRLSKGWSPPRFFAAGVGMVSLLLVSASVMVRQSSFNATTEGWWHSVMATMQHTGESYLPQQNYESSTFMLQAGSMASKGLFIAGATLLGLALLLLFARKWRLAVWLLLGLAVVELFVFARNTVTHFDAARAANPALEQFLKAHPGDYRISHPANPNSALTMGAQDVWGYDPGVTLRYAQLVGFTQNIHPADLAGGFSLRYHRLFGMLRCRFAVTPKGDDPSSIDEHTNYLPHLLLVQKYRVLKDPAEIFYAMVNAKFDPREEVILETEPNPKPLPAKVAGVVKLVNFSTDWLEIEADVPSPAILLVTDTFAKGWRARALRGSAQSSYQVMPANLSLRAVPLAAGHHLLRMEYEPIGFRIGKWVSIISLAAFLALAAMCLRRRSRAVSGKKTVDAVAAGVGAETKIVANTIQLALGQIHEHSGIVVGVGLALVTLAVFWPVIRYDFVYLDDSVYVTDNARVLQGLTWDSVRWSFTTLEAAFWQPLTWLSYLLDVTLFGKSAGAMHLTNLLLHVASTVLLFTVLRQMTGALWRSAVVSALFALHPLHVESVAWIAERKDVLSTLFWMLTLLFYVRYAQSPIANRKSKIANYSLALFFFFCGVMSKTMVVTLPVVMLILDWWPLGRVSSFKFQVSGSRGGSPTPSSLDARASTEPRKLSGLDLRPIWRLFLEKIPFLAMGFIAGLVTLYAEKREGAVTNVEHLSVIVRFANAAISSVKYLAQTFWPTGLAVFYPYPKTFWLWTVVGAWLLVVALTAAALWFGRRRPYALAGWLWYAVTLLPVCGLIQVGAHQRADRYTYVPLIGVSIVLVWAVGELLETWRASKAMRVTLAGLALIVCAVLTRNQLQYWQGSEALFRRAIAVTQNNDIAYNNLGNALFRQKRYAEAKACFETLLRIKPNSTEAHNNLGVIALDQNKLDEAMKHFQAALHLDPNNAQAHGNLGNVLNLRHQYPEAIEEYEVALRFKPDYTVAHNNLGAAYELTKRIPEAVEQYRLAIKYDPNYPDARKNLGMILIRQGHFAEAIDPLRIAIRAWPNDVRLYFNLGTALSSCDQFDEAISSFEAALRLEPGNTEIRYSQATALPRVGRVDEAIEQYRLTLVNKPDHAAAHNELGILLARKKLVAEATVEFQEAVRYQPDVADFHYNLGNVLIDQRQFNEAARQYREVLRLSPSDAPAHYKLGYVLAELGKRDEASAQLNEALRLKPDYTAAKEQLHALGVTVAK